MAANRRRGFVPELLIDFVTEHPKLSLALAFEVGQLAAWLTRDPRGVGRDLGRRALHAAMTLGAWTAESRLLPQWVSAPPLQPERRTTRARRRAPARRPNRRRTAHKQTV